MLLAAWLMFCVQMVLARSALESKYDVTVLENGVLVREEIELRPGLQVFHVPRHHDRQQVVVYVDLDNNLQLTKFVELNKCHLQELNIERLNVTEEIEGLEAIKASNYVSRADDATVISHTEMEFPDALEDLSFLRQELQQACRDLPVYRALEVDVRNRTDEDFLVPVPQPVTSRNRREFQCLGSEFFQKCKISNPVNSCFYVVNCATVSISATCIKHITTTSIKCKPCCDNLNAPTTGSFKQCSLTPV